MLTMVLVVVFLTDFCLKFGGRKYGLSYPWMFFTMIYLTFLASFAKLAKEILVSNKTSALSVLGQLIGGVLLFAMISLVVAIPTFISSNVIGLLGAAAIMAWLVKPLLKSL